LEDFVIIAQFKMPALIMAPWARHAALSDYLNLVATGLSVNKVFKPSSQAEHYCRHVPSLGKPDEAALTD